MKVLKRILLGVVAVVVALVVLAVRGPHVVQHPQNAAGMAAETVCAATFVAGREPDAQQIMADDVLPASGVLKAISTEIDEQNKTVSARFLGLFGRTAALAPDRGCVLDLSPDPTAEGYQPPALDPAPWPAGDAATPGAASAALEQVVDAAFEGAGDPRRRMLAASQWSRAVNCWPPREAPGFDPNVALHGWSMTKTIAAMLFYKKAQEVGLDLNLPVVDAIPADRAPSWVAQWKQDGRGPDHRRGPAVHARRPGPQRGVRPDGRRGADALRRARHVGVGRRASAGVEARYAVGVSERDVKHPGRRNPEPVRN